ncbi:hypothetical protein ACHWQZ_G017148 [Mnemiopsis leidyi]
MSFDRLDVKNIYVIGGNLKSRLCGQLESQFSGQKLVSWLLEHDGLVNTREEGEKLGRYLVEYRVIQNIDEKYHFLDDSSRLYSFCCDDQHNIYPRTESQQQIWVQGLSVMRRYNLDITGAKKRRTSWINFNKGGQSNCHFKGKHLLDWLEVNTDFETRDDCRRFLKSLLKLNFLRCSQNDLRFDPSSEYWFYLTKLKDEVSKARRISRTLMPEGRRQSIHEKPPKETLNRKQSVLGFTPDLIAQLASSQPSITRGRDSERIKLKDTCVVLRSSLSRNSLNASQTSLTRSNTSLSQSSSALQSGFLASSTTSLPNAVRDSGQSLKHSFREDVNSAELDTQTYISRLKEQYADNLHPRKRSSQSESRNETAVSSLIESKDFQRRLQNIGKSSSQKNLKQVETDRRLILCQLTERKYGKVASDVLSPSSSCPINLDSLLKRDYSTESQATKSSGYGSIRDKCSSVTSRDSSSCLSEDGESIRSSLNSVCSTPTSQCDNPTENCCFDIHNYKHKVTTTRDLKSGEAELSEHNSSEPVPPPRRSLEREPLTTESDNETPVNSRLLLSGAMNLQTATSARRARLTRTRAVSDGNSKST